MTHSLRRGLSFVVIALLFVFLSLPLAGILLFAAVFIFGYTPPLWLAVVIDGGMLLNLVLLPMCRRYASARSR